MLATVETAPAGGAAATQVLIGALVSGAVMTAIVALGLAHRWGHTDVLERAGRALGRYFALPGWALVPVAIALPAFVVAGFGFVWDVSIHVDQGRDTGPFGTPAHYFMLAGIYGFVAAGFTALAMPREKPRASWLRVAHGWYAPVSAVLMLGCAFFSMLGFPLDDLWHRLFGQDVTLWGPTHQMMICGGVLAFVALAMLVREARAFKRPAGSRRAGGGAGVSGLIACGILLTALTIAWQQEFAYGVGEFRLLFQPLLIAFSGALMLVVARLSLGRGAALGTGVIASAIMGALTLAVGPVVGSSTHHFPLYLAEALVVELVGLTRLPRRPYAFAVASGLGVGSIGVVTEWGWSHLWMPIAWPGHFVPEAILRSLPVAVAAAVIGAFVAGAFKLPAAEYATRRRAWVPAAVALAVAIVSLGILLPSHAPRSTFTISTAPHPGAASGKRTIDVTVHPSDPRAVRDADWFEVMAWQGKEHRHLVDALRQVAPGVYRSTEPLPAYGTWKAILRYANGSELGAHVLYAPADRAIPAPGIEPAAHFTGTLTSDRDVLQRERRHDVPAWLFAAASALVAALVIALLVAFGWAALRVARSAGQEPTPARLTAPRMPFTKPAASAAQSSFAASTASSIETSSGTSAR